MDEVSSKIDDETLNSIGRQNLLWTSKIDDFLNFLSKIQKILKNSKNILGGKGANLAEMGKLGLPVPPGFTISTEVCELFYKNKKKLNLKILKEINKELKNIEKKIRKKIW